MKKLLFTIMAIAMGWVTSQFVFAQDAPDIDDSILRPADVFELEYASNPQISPDGSRIIYSRNHFDIMTDGRKSDLWLIDEHGHHMPLITGGNILSAQWSPSGDRIMYVTMNDGKSQIHCHWVQDDRSAPLSRLTESPGGMTWSPDGTQIAFFMRVPAKPEPFATLPAKPEGAEWADPPTMITRLRYRADGAGFLRDGFTQLFVMSADGGTPRQITSGDFNHGGSICWLPDGQSIILSANRHENSDFQPVNSELYRVDLASREITQLTTRDGPDASPAMSDDGLHLAFTGYDDQKLGSQNADLYVMSPDGSNRRVLASIDRGIGSPMWSQYHNGFLFTYTDQGNSKLAVAKLDGTIERMADNLGSNATGRPYTRGGGFSVAENGTVAFCITTPQHPGDLARRMSGGPVERLTDLNKDLLGHKTLGEVREMRFTSSFDDREVQSWVILPPNYDENEKYPMILEIHGGPFSAYGDVFTAELQLMAAAGYVVLYVNPRGSTSYGQEFANQIHHNYPGQDYDDLMSGVDRLIEDGIVDEDQLYVTGGSGGGVLTAWIVGNTNRFNAAVVAKPVINWYSFALTSDGYNYFYQYWFPGYPWEHTEQYMKRSPISLVGNVETPTMLLTGEEDYRTPMSESEQFYQALQLRGIDSALVRIPGASHGIAARPSHLCA
ncbi:MAG: S9 family peptidase, partial [Pirellulaceae bacterium]